MQNDHVRLRPTETADLERLFQFQLDKEACYLAAFMPADHANQEAYRAKYTRFLLDPGIHMQTILLGETIVGSIARFMREGDAEITYWIDRSRWGQGVATTAVRQFLALETTRPIFGRVVSDNVGSRKVLENCGFVQIGTDRGFANARQTEVEEYIYRLA
ncbi:GNAT family N-acetyltransferase [Hymenobacter sp. DG01]|uniref:GNAT family N-acetyltransferase n=1 Tax=Hymenobacter sp. DG01 TaxID=2584940 RepID=UPI001122973B|nr:GNAT family N-acetyltransferase [Hymenobacter sp. DG01]